MSYRSDKQKLTDTQIHTHTDTGDDNTRRPKGPRVTIGHLYYATSSSMHRFEAIGEFKLELQSANAQSGSNSTIFRAVTMKFDV